MLPIRIIGVVWMLNSHEISLVLHWELPLEIATPQFVGGKNSEGVIFAVALCTASTPINYTRCVRSKESVPGGRSYFWTDVYAPIREWNLFYGFHSYAVWFIMLFNVHFYWICVGSTYCWLNTSEPQHETLSGQQSFLKVETTKFWWYSFSSISCWYESGNLDVRVLYELMMMLMMI